MDYTPEIAMFTVTGKLMYGNPDTADPGIAPNLEPVRGAAITFTPELDPPIFKAAAANAWIYQRPIPASTDYDGNITGLQDTSPDVMLPYQAGQTWRVVVEVPDFPTREFSITGSPGGTVNIASVVPVPADPGTDIIAWEAVVSEVTDARDDAVAAAVAAGASNPGVANGTATLDGSTKLTPAQVPTYLTASSLTAAYVPNDTLTVLAPRATGTDQSAALLAGITSAVTFGLWFALNGDHIISDHLDLPSGAKIDGSRGTLTQTTNLKATFRINGKTGIKIRGVRATGKTTDYVNTSAVYPAAGVYIMGTSSDITIDDCEFLGMAGAGVYMVGTTTGVRIRNTKMTGAGPIYILDATYNFGAGVATLNGASDWSVEGCDISNFTQGIVTGEGSNIRVVDNHVHHIVGQHGFYFTPLVNAVIANNLVHDCLVLGMKIQIASSSSIDSDSVIIADNVFRNCGAQGILLTNITPGNGLKLRNVSVTGNVVTAAGLTGIEANNCIGLHISDNYVIGAQSGIKIDTSSAVSGGGDHLSTFTRSGLIITSSTDVHLHALRIMNPGSGAVSTDRFGVLINGATSADITLRGFKVTDTTANMVYAVYLAAGDSTSMDFIDVIGTGATAYGWRMQTSGAVRTMRGCTFAGTTGAMTTPPTNYAQNADTSGATLTALETEVNELKAVLRAAGLIRT